MAEDIWEAYAIRYAWHNRQAHENFLGGDPHNHSSMPMDYFVWVVRCGGRVFAMDTGFDAPMAAKRGRQYLHAPQEGLRQLGIEPASVQDVVVSHMHYDHCGNHSLYPNARYHVQDREMQYTTGRHMCHQHMRSAFEADDVVEMVRRLFAGKLAFHNGDDELAPGLTLHYVGGHSMGLQMLRVHTRRGWVVLASDAAHYYANLERGLPYPITYNVAEALEAFDRARALADSPNHMIPGHDPLVLQRYPAPKPELQGWIARLD